MTRAERSSLTPAWPLLTAMAASLVVYFAVTRVFLVSDDFINMLTFVNHGTAYFLLEPFGGHMLLFRNALFALSYELFGLHAEAYGWFTLVTHLVNVALVFRFTKRLSDSAALAGLAAIFWGASPLLAETLTWYSVHGQVIATMLLLVVLDGVAAPRSQDRVLPLGKALLWTLLLWLGAMSFGVGIAVALTFPAVLALLRPRSLGENATRNVFGFFPLFVVFVYFGSRRLFHHYFPGGGDEGQTLRLSPFGDVMVLFGHFLAVSTSGLLRSFAYQPLMFHAAAPAVPLLVFAYSGLLVAGFYIGDERTRRQIAALLLVTLAIYGLIALGRAASYSAFGTPMAVAAQTGRYHYLATAPLAIAAALSIGAVGRLVPDPELIPGTALIGWTLIGAYFYAASDWAIQERPECRAAVTSELHHIVEAVDAEPPGSDVYLPNHPLPKTVTVFFGYDELPGPAALFALEYPTNELHGRRVHFVEDEDLAGLFRSPENRRLSKLLVPPSPGLRLSGQAR